MSDRQFADPSSSPVIATVLRQSSVVLQTYRVDPGLVQEHANGEVRITQGGYGDRQLFELVQNGADEIAAAPGGKLHVVLTDTHLYCANEGTEVTAEGAETILRMSVSRKRGGQIGRFGVGVKSVLSVSDTPQFFSLSGSFGFDRDWSAGEIAAALGDTGPLGMDTPVLRMARPLDVDREKAEDSVLASLLKWASTVVRLPSCRAPPNASGTTSTATRAATAERSTPSPPGSNCSPHTSGRFSCSTTGRCPRSAARSRWRTVVSTAD